MQRVQRTLRAFAPETNAVGLFQPENFNGSHGSNEVKDTSSQSVVKKIIFENERISYGETLLPKSSVKWKWSWRSRKVAEIRKRQEKKESRGFLPCSSFCLSPLPRGTRPIVLLVKR